MIELREKAHIVVNQIPPRRRSAQDIDLAGSGRMARSKATRAMPEIRVRLSDGVAELLRLLQT